MSITLLSGQPKLTPRYRTGYRKPTDNEWRTFTTHLTSTSSDHGIPKHPDHEIPQHAAVYCTCTWCTRHGYVHAAYHELHVLSHGRTLRSNANNDSVFDSNTDCMTVYRSFYTTTEKRLTQRNQIRYITYDDNSRHQVWLWVGSKGQGSSHRRRDGKMSGRLVLLSECLSGDCTNNNSCMS